LTKELPAITQEGLSAGMEWGRKLRKKVLQRLHEKGYQT
jgi:hypothetical protein